MRDSVGGLSANSLSNCHYPPTLADNQKIGYSRAHDSYQPPLVEMQEIKVIHAHTQGHDLIHPLDETLVMMTRCRPNCTPKKSRKVF